MATSARDAEADRVDYNVPARHERYASTWLSRMGATPLSLFINQVGIRYADDEDKQPSQTADGRQRDEAHVAIVKRCTVLKLLIVNQPFLERLIAAVNDARGLRELAVLTSRWPADRANRALSAPLRIELDIVKNLRMLELPRTDFGRAIFVDPLLSPCVHLQKVILEQNMTWLEFVQWLTFCPNLSEAQFRVFDKEPEPEPPSTTLSFTSNIRKLSLLFSVVSREDHSTLTPIRLPLMETLSLKVSIQGLGGTFNTTLEQLARLLLEEAPKLENIQFINTYFLHSNQILDFLKGTPKIVYLGISGTGDTFRTVPRGLIVSTPVNIASTLCPKLEYLDLSSCCAFELPELIDMIASRCGVRTVI
jgi:hypothetical protein